MNGSEGQMIARAMTRERTARRSGRAGREGRKGLVLLLVHFDSFMIIAKSFFYELVILCQLMRALGNSLSNDADCVAKLSTDGYD